MQAQDVIKLLGLVPLPKEGGFYKETYKSPIKIHEGSNQRDAGSAIYFLLTIKDFSALHKLKNDEIIHFYAGDCVEMLQLSDSGEANIISVGNNLQIGERPQIVAPAGVWQGSRLKSGGSWALLGTTMAPGFDWNDFVLAKRSELLTQFPQHAKLIECFTREDA